VEAAMIGPLSFARFIALLFCLLVAQHKGKNRRTRQKRKGLYSKSEKNAIIDSVVHPWADEHWGFVIVDGVLHALNERDPVESFIKFLKYNAPELLKRILREIR
jgi:hypothetical protein